MKKLINKITITALAIATMLTQTSHAANYDKILNETISKYQLVNIVIASNKSYADSISSVNLLDGDTRLLLVDSPKEALEQLEKRNTFNVYLIGGPNTLSKEYDKVLKFYGPKRIYGSDRYETNKEVLNKSNVNDTIKVFASSFQDPLMATNYIYGTDKYVEFIKDNKAVKNNNPIKITTPVKKN